MIEERGKLCDETNSCVLDRYIENIQHTNIDGKEKMYLIIDAIIDLCELIRNIHKKGKYCINLVPSKVRCSENKLQLLGINSFMTKEQLYKKINVGNVKGYIAPEVIMYEGFCVNGTFVDGQKADIFCIGSLLYWSVTGKRIHFLQNQYNFDSHGIYVEQVVDYEKVKKLLVCHRYLQCLREDIHKKYCTDNSLDLKILEEIFLKSLCRNVDRRYENIEQMLKKLELFKKKLC